MSQAQACSNAGRERGEVCAVKAGLGPPHGVCRARLSAHGPAHPLRLGAWFPPEPCPEGDPAAGHGGLHRPLSSAPGPPVPFTCISEKRMPHSEQARPEPDLQSQPLLFTTGHLSSQ